MGGRNEAYEYMHKIILYDRNAGMVSARIITGNKYMRTLTEILAKKYNAEDDKDEAIPLLKQMKKASAKFWKLLSSSKFKGAGATDTAAREKLTDRIEKVFKTGQKFLTPPRSTLYDDNKELGKVMMTALDPVMDLVLKIKKVSHHNSKGPDREDVEKIRQTFWDAY